MASVLATRIGAALATLGLAVSQLACSKDAPPPRPEAAEPAPAVGTPGEWIGAAERLAREATSLELLRGAPRAQQFDALVGSGAWRNVEFGRDGQEVVRYFPAVKTLSLLLVRLEAHDELARLGVYNLDVLAVMLASGRAFVAGLAPDDPTRTARSSTSRRWCSVWQRKRQRGPLLRVRRVEEGARAPCLHTSPSPRRTRCSITSRSR